MISTPTFTRRAPIPEEPAPVVTLLPKRPIPCDGVFATAVLSPTRLMAIFYWARYKFYGKPLVLCDYDVNPLTGKTWVDIEHTLKGVMVERNSRLAFPIGVYVENDTLAQQARESSETLVFSIPEHLVRPEAWPVLCQSAAVLLARGDVGYTAHASQRMDARPFLTQSGVATGPRPEEDPTIVAFLYGVVLGLDPIAARDPHPKPPVRAARN